MYNIVVSSNMNNCLNLRRRSFTTLASKIDGLSSHTSQDMQSSRGRNMFCLTRAKPRDYNSPREQEFQVQMFNEQRKMAGICKRRQVFSLVYDFSFFIYIHKPRSENILNRLPIAQAVAFQHQTSDAGALTVVHTSTGTNHNGEAAAEGLSVLETSSNGQVTQANANENRVVDSQVATAASFTGTAMFQAPATITSEHVSMLRARSKSIPNSSGKWEYIQTVYQKHYPHLPLSNNALRCRLKEKKPGPNVCITAPACSSAPVIPPRKRRTTSCSSCRQRKTRRGDLTRNPYCTQAVNTDSNSVKRSR
ncbi:hypothetical protein PHMEG_00035750 [Phytophthora megakarya]|uniref:Uncharacterized protein n=1 Tax=Phytophthora megakarya TaxID=4795 RepID=A0A225UMZ4_9STRA|nr:hypothetical protein PHMEG_00035750 [Phytophthora megakarya]